MPNKFWIMSKDDEKIEMFVGEKSVGTFDHDTHGWSGMRDAEKFFERIATAVGAKFEKR